MKSTTGIVVACRQRQWVVLPSENPDLVRLRPLSGNESQICGVYLPLEKSAIASAEFPLPKATELGDQEASQLLFNADRLSLRSGAGPFRCVMSSPAAAIAAEEMAERQPIGEKVSQVVAVGAASVGQSLDLEPIGHHSIPVGRRDGMQGNNARTKQSNVSYSNSLSPMVGQWFQVVRTLIITT